MSTLTIVRVHWHLQKKAFSVSSKRYDGAWRVFRDALGKQVCLDALLLEGVKFVVQPAGKRRDRELGIRSVHAYLQGTLVQPTFKYRHIGEVKYSPFAYEGAYFLSDGEPIRTAEMVSLHNGLINTIERL